ncbi:retrovirus-related pol polyprotein from transposon TNT 1-94 [Tanacetum coccineum]
MLDLSRCWKRLDPLLTSLSSLKLSLVEEPGRDHRIEKSKVEAKPFPIVKWFDWNSRIGQDQFSKEVNEARGAKDTLGYSFEEGSVQLGDNRECKIKGIGKVRIQLRDGLSFVLNNVRYIPELKRNLISLGTFKKEGFTVKLQSRKVKVINGSRVVFSRIQRDNCVYSLDGHEMAGKSLRVSFGVGRHTTQGVIDYVHLDLWGPSQEGIGLYPQRFKQEAFGKFKEWKQLVENQTGRTVKKPRTDNGLELCNREFEQLCIKSGIARHLTVIGTPQQNRLAERMNRTLMHKVEVELQRLNNHTPKEYDQKDGDDEDAGDQEIDLTPDLIDYQLAQDREPRTRTKPLRFRDESNMAAYAFVAVEEEDTHEPLTYQEAVVCKDSSKWKADMKE